MNQHNESKRRDFAKVAWADLARYTAAIMTAERQLEAKATTLRSRMEHAGAAVLVGAVDDLRELREKIETGGR
ncbi:MAG: hypothetical protein R6U63_13815 [Longimicrobiales bacterium]